jgi:hypothetical protein
MRSPPGVPPSGERVEPTSNLSHIMFTAGGLRGHERSGRRHAAS